MHADRREVPDAPGDLDRADGRRLRGDWLLLLVVVLFLASAVGVYFVLRWARGQELELVTNRVLLTLLMLGVGVLVLALVVVLLRNLIKVLVERQRGVLGSRFRTKLVFSFLMLCLLPSVALFAAAIRVIEQTVEGLFTPTVEKLAGLSQEIADDYSTRHKKEARRFAAQIARQIAREQMMSPRDQGAFRSMARAWLTSYHLDFVVVFDERGRAIVREANVRPGEPGSPPEEKLLAVPEYALERALEGREAGWLEPVGTGLQAGGVAPIPARIDSEEVSGAMACGFLIGPETARKAALIADINQEYHDLKAFRRDIKRVYIAFFLLLTVLILVSGAWLGLYLARQITVPIQRLAEGTREIASGNLDYRVEAEAGDEIGELIDSFNRMTGDIQKAGQQLDERRQYIETLLENVPAGVISLDPDRRITTVNRAAYALLAIDPAEDLTGRTAREALDGPALAPIADLVSDGAAGEGIHGTRDVTLSAGGRTVTLAVAISSSRDDRGRPLGTLVVLEDLTLLIRAQKSAAWREAARRIAHEIKNPLTPIQLSAQRILKKSRESAEDLTQVLEEGTETIISEVRSLKAMVDEFSRFARVPPVTPVPCDPNEVIESALTLYDGTRPGIRFVRDFETPVAPMLMDPEQMKRALINLLDNAIAAVGERGTIKITSMFDAGGSLLRITVGDDGPGIPSEDKDRLFIPYFSTGKRGTGLGLAIVNRIVSDHLGTIRVEDNVPRGARFIIEIPRAGENHAA